MIQTEVWSNDGNVIAYHPLYRRSILLNSIDGNKFENLYIFSSSHTIKSLSIFQSTARSNKEAIQQASSLRPFKKPRILQKWKSIWSRYWIPSCFFMDTCVYSGLLHLFSSLLIPLESGVRELNAFGWLSPHLSLIDFAFLYYSIFKDKESRVLRPPGLYTEVVDCRQIPLIYMLDY